MKRILLILAIIIMSGCLNNECKEEWIDVQDVKDLPKGFIPLGIEGNVIVRTQYIEEGKPGCELVCEDNVCYNNAFGIVQNGIFYCNNQSYRYLKKC